MGEQSQTAADESIRVVRNDDESRYEIWVDDTLGGFTQITEDADGRVHFPHTEVDPAFKGKGLGGTLVGEALADVVQQGRTIVPECGFVRKYLRDNEVDGAVVEWPDAAGDAAAPGATRA